jgi:hypothetical protein
MSLVHPSARPGRIKIAFLATAATAFLVLFDYNPHCTQRVSFAIAVVDMENHLEDKGWNGPPLAYQRPFVWPIRGVLTLAALAGLFAPAAVNLLVRSGSVAPSHGAAAQVCTSLTPVLLSLLPQAIIGERFQDLLRATSLCAVVLLTVSLVTVRRRDVLAD